jgi:hypothetical protein
MSGEPVVSRVTNTPTVTQNTITDIDRRVGELERQSRKLASNVSVLTVATFAELPPVDAVPPNVEARVLSLNQRWSIQAGVWFLNP